MFRSFSAGTDFGRQNLTSIDSDVQSRSPHWKGQQPALEDSGHDGL